MNILLEELTGGLPDTTQFAHIIIRLLAAMLLGAIIGYQRERAGKAAGLRTHMLVAMGSALFVLGSAAAEMSTEGLSRVIQGIATGIGFIGAGSILKRQEEREIEGLTTAAGIWMTAAVGVTVGLGRLGLALLSVILTWVVLSLFGYLSARIAKKDPASADHVHE
jgi:putative Mg2+ transporter-C (MgtC) family protein